MKAESRKGCGRSRKEITNIEMVEKPHQKQTNIPVFSSRTFDEIPVYSTPQIPINNFSIFEEAMYRPAVGGAAVAVSAASVRR